MSFLCRGKYKQSANPKLHKLYDYLRERFNALSNFKYHIGSF